jgi:hypothetical protein
VAVAAWRGLLEGRFRLLERWCAYMATQYRPLVVTEDTWVQVGIFFAGVVLQADAEGCWASLEHALGLSCRLGSRAQPSAMHKAMICGGLSCRQTLRDAGLALSMP